MKKKREILVGVQSRRETVADALRALERAEKGLPPKEPVHQLYFEDMGTLLKHLSPRRWELLQRLRTIGPINIRRLALKLKRDYKNVHTDISDLKHIGLVEETKDKKFTVPWDEIVGKLPLLSKAI